MLLVRTREKDRAPHSSGVKRNTMNQETALKSFLTSVIIKRWKDRYLSLISTQKGKNKFLKDLYHSFEEKIEPTKIVIDFDEKIWNLPAFSYSEIGGFGNDEVSLKDGLKKYEGDGCLIVDCTAKYGIYIPESMIDEIKYLNV